MFIKKIFVLLLLVSLLLASVSGCSHSDKNKEVSKVAMGRYVENSIDMPKAIQSREEIAFIMVKNPKGELEIYASLAKHKKGENNIKYTLKKDTTWERTVPKWLNEDGMKLNAVTYADDGTRYTVVSFSKDNLKKVKILKNTNNENPKEIILEDYKKSVDYNKVPYSISVLKDNSVLLSYYGSCTVYKDGKEKVSFKIGDFQYSLFGDKLLTMNENMDGGKIVDVDTGKTISTIMIDSQINKFTVDKDGNWFLLNDNGVERMAKGGDTWETILDADRASMSKPTLYADAMLFGSNNDFYIMYQGENGLRTLKYYIYDKNIPFAPVNKISIVTLNESFTIKQLISDFNQANPDVMVDYQVLMGDNHSTTINDQIKALNTELLAGKGPDILVLDGLPMNSYIEKNVLADISGIINPLIKNGEVLNNVMNNFKTKDGKIYTAPLRITIPIAFGNKEAVSSAKSINTLADYAKASTIPLFGANVLSYSDLTTILYRLYSNSFLEDNGINHDGLINFLQNLKIISDQTKTKEEPTNLPVYMEMSNTTFSRLIYDKNALLGINDLWHMMGVYEPLAVNDVIDGAYTLVNKEFTPRQLISINKASTNKKLANKFIRALFDESVQKTAIGDGFPVNEKALMNFGMEPIGEMGWDNFSISQPSKEKMQNILDLFKAADSPVIVNQELLDMVISETKAYLSGKEGLNSTADKIIAKTKIQLAE